MRNRIIPLLLLILLNGCGPTSTKPVDDADIAPDRKALEFIKSNNFVAAAEEYIKLAQQDRKKNELYKLKAAQAYIDAEYISDAENIIQAIKPDNLGDLQSAEFKIIQAQIFLALNNYSSGLEAIPEKLPQEFPRNLHFRFNQTRGRLLEQNGQLLLAANQRLILNQYLDDTYLIENNQEKIWQLINNNNVDEINTYRLTSADLMASWLELSIINKTMVNNRSGLESAIQSWTQRYPDHPAIKKIIPDIFNYLTELSQIPKQIALLLPFNSRFGDAAEAISEGFMAAWYLSPGDKPVIKMYDSSLDNIEDVYRTAVTEGAEFIIGPLEKDAVEKLIQQGHFPVKTLVLNNSDLISNVLPDLLQFGLSPEDEAIQLAERAWFDGNANAIAISTATSKEDRIINAFKKRWDELGGKLIQHARMETNIEEYSEPIKQLLNIDKSDEREKLLQSRLSRILYAEPRRRQDIDFIFMAVDPNSGRQIVPQLLFYRASEIPVYSPSGIYTGILNPETDKDLNNVIFTDIPWVVDPSHEYSEIQRLLENTRSQSRSAYRRLYAFGIDAYKLVIELGTLLTGNEPVSGETGLLKLGNNGKIIRKLKFAKFIDGKPVLIDN